MRFTYDDGVRVGFDTAHARHRSVERGRMVQIKFLEHACDEHNRVRRSQHEALQQARFERDEARRIVHGMWTFQTPTDATVHIWNLAAERVTDWSGEGPVMLEMADFGRALRGDPRAIGGAS
jgi:hypothetical protein